MTEREDAIKTLEELRRYDPSIQRGRRRELNENFKRFWDTSPTEESFVKVMDGLIFTPCMLYYMTTYSIGKKIESSSQPAATDTVSKISHPPNKGGKHRS